MGENGRRDRQIGMFLIPTELKEMQKAPRHRDPGTTEYIGVGTTT
jgi:hypothetical protein